MDVFGQGSARALACLTRGHVLSCLDGDIFLLSNNQHCVSTMTAIGFHETTAVMVGYVCWKSNVLQERSRRANDTIIFNTLLQTVRQ